MNWFEIFRGCESRTVKTMFNKANKCNFYFPTRHGRVLNGLVLKMELEFGVLVFCGMRKAGEPEKNPRFKDENQ